MISSVVYTPINSLQNSTVQTTKSPVFQILISKIIVVVLIFLLGDILSQELACICVAVACSLQFWITKNVGRKYLMAYWSIDTSGEEQVWIYQANFKSPSSLQEIFWYSQVVYAVVLIVAGGIILSMKKYSLLCAIIIGWVANYVNFYAFSKIISLRNAGVFGQIADEASVGGGSVKSTIRLPMVHRKNENRLSGFRSTIKSSVY